MLVMIIILQKKFASKTDTQFCNRTVVFYSAYINLKHYMMYMFYLLQNLNHYKLSVT